MQNFFLESVEKTNLLWYINPKNKFGSDGNEQTAL